MLYPRLLVFSLSLFLSYWHWLSSSTLNPLHGIQLKSSSVSQSASQSASLPICHLRNQEVFPYVCQAVSIIIQDVAMKINGEVLFGGQSDSEWWPVEIGFTVPHSTHSAPVPCLLSSSSCIMFPGCFRFYSTVSIMRGYYTAIYHSTKGRKVDQVLLINYTHLVQFVGMETKVHIS